MRLSINFAALEANLERMGAHPAAVATTRQPPRRPPDLSGFKTEVSLDKVRSESGVLSYEGRQVVLYIPDQNTSLASVAADPSEGRKFHVAECTVLQRMRRENRFERYVATNNLSGKFRVTFDDRMTGSTDEHELPLLVCQKCLEKLNYKDVRRLGNKKAVAKKFDIEEFFVVYSSLFDSLPSRTDSSDLSAGYAEDWSEISQRYRERVGFVCEECGVDLKNHKRLLHTHHLDGVKRNNAPSNLRALCVDCHRKQPYHERMFVKHDDMALINRLRVEQQGRPDHWSELIKLADSALEGFLRECERLGAPVPTVGEELIDDGGAVVAEIEIAWPRSKVGIALSEVEASAIRDRGWRTWNMSDALDEVKQICSLVAAR